MTRPTVSYDAATEEWVAHLPGPGNPIVRTESLELLEEFLDYVESVVVPSARG